MAATQIQDPLSGLWVPWGNQPRAVICAQDVLTRAEADFLRLQSLFGISLPRATVIVAGLSPGSDGTGGAYHWGCGDANLYCDASFADPRRTSALFLAELSEVGQAVQSQGWDCGATNGEGLSRVHAEILYPNELNDFESASAWLDSRRPDWVSQNDSTDQDPVSNGCAVLFLTWLAFLGYGYDKVTQAAAGSLWGTYRRLTGKTTAFADFTAAVNARWPAGQPSGVTMDNPWGAAPPPPPPTSGVQITLSQPLQAGTYNVLPAAA